MGRSEGRREGAREGVRDVIFVAVCLLAHQALQQTGKGNEVPGDVDVLASCSYLRHKMDCCNSRLHWHRM